MLKIADNLQLPLDAVTQTFAALAMRGAGKTNLARVMAEGMHAASLPFVAIDPVGSWWGLRSARDGKSPGIDIPIFGGRKGDVPLEKTGGLLVADLIADERLSCILDVSDFSEGDKTRFLIDFAERLYRKNQMPLHLFLEEADDYIPQKPFHEQARLLRAWENIVRRGRARGLGMTMITQRSAVVNKNVLTQVETLFVLRTTSPQDRKAIGAWVDFHGQSRDLLDSLPGLASGEAWIWSPSWLGKCERIKVRLSTTFDSGATPKDTKGKKPPTNLAEIDLGAIKVRMAETIERAKADDPRELRREIAALKKQLAEQKPVVDHSAVDRAVAAERKRWQQFITKRDALVESLKNRMRKASGLLELTVADDAQGISCVTISRQHPSAQVRTPQKPAVQRPIPEKRVNYASNDAGELGSSGKRRMLVALAQNPSGLTASKLSILTGIAKRGGTFRTYLGSLKTLGYATGDHNALRITDDGLAALGDFEPLPTGAELVAYWANELGDSGIRKIFDVLVEAYPEALTKEQIAEQTGIAVEGGTFRTYLGKLKTLELVEGRGEIRASDSLFE